MVKKGKLNIFDYFVITVLIVIVIYVSIVKISSFKSKSNIREINMFIYCENVPVSTRERLKKGIEVYAGARELNFGKVGEVDFFHKSAESKFMSVEFNAICKARKNDNGGYIIDGTTYYLGQEIRLFTNSALMVGYIYEIEEINK